MRLLLLLLLSTSMGYPYAQSKDSLAFYLSPIKKPGYGEFKKIAPELKPTVRTLMASMSLISYGIIAQLSPDLRELDSNIKSEVRKNKPNFRIHIDDYLQYAPGLSVYALNALGIKGKHDFKDMTLTYILSTVISGIFVQSVKAISKVERPDGMGTNAFPSGHTATAFAGAEFLRQEYKDVSPWFGVAGYTVATATGILRMYNNKHWFRDVMAGAGFGILSTKIAYWLYPVIEKKLFGNKPNHTLKVAY